MLGGHGTHFALLSEEIMPSTHYTNAIRVQQHDKCEERVV